MKNYLAAVLPLSLLSLAALATGAHAQLNVTFQTPKPVTFSSLPQTVAVTGTLSNGYAVPLFLNGDFNLVDAPLTIDDSPFQNTFVYDLNPVSLPARGGRHTGTLFDILVPGGTAAGDYSGLFVLQGGSDTSSLTDLSDTTFSLDVLPAAVPEASTTVSFGLLLLLGSAVLAVRAMKLRKA